MKTQVSAVDVFYLSHELGEALSSARFDKAYHPSQKTLKMGFYSKGTGAVELLIDPRHICLTGYSSQNPEKPSGFAMQLRKNLGGGFVRGLRQHGFDRIIELEIERAGKRFVLIAELFSTGNIILCDQDLRILGLMERQEWKDRTLKVGERYAYPPETTNPLEVDHDRFKETLSSSGKKTASVLATDLGLGGTYAEEVCLLAGIGKEEKACRLSDKEVDAGYQAYGKLVAAIRKRESRPQIVLEGDGYFDVVPFDLGVYSGKERRFFDSFSSAVDEYFQEKGSAEKKGEAEEGRKKEIAKLAETRKKQVEVIARFEKEAAEGKESGDAIYQEMESINALIKSINQEKKGGRALLEINKEIKGKKLKNIEIEELTDEGVLVIKIEG